MKVGYVVDQYPHFATPFIVDEILAHEEAGLQVEIYSLKPTSDSHFLPSISRVSAPVRYLSRSYSAEALWSQMREAGSSFPNFWSRLGDIRESDVSTIAQAIELARLVGQNGVVHLHAHFATAPTTVARLAASLANVPYTFTAHTRDLIGASVDEQDLEAKIRDASGTITVNDFSLEYIQKAFGSAAARVERVYAGLRTEALPFTSPASRPRLVVGVGPLEEASGFEYLIDAVAKLIERGQHLHCRIIGSGPLEDELDTQIVNLNLRESVRLIVTSSEEEVHEAIRNAAVLTAPSVVDEDGSTGGVPSALLEAMTVGTPCVSTDAGGIPEVVVDGQTGIQVPQRDSDALARAIDELLSDDVKRVRLALKARVLVESEFNIHRNSERMRSFFGASRGDGAAQPIEPPSMNGADTSRKEAVDDEVAGTAEEEPLLEDE